MLFISRRLSQILELGSANIKDSRQQQWRSAAYADFLLVHFLLCVKPLAKMSILITPIFPFYLYPKKNCFADACPIPGNGKAILTHLHLSWKSWTSVLKIKSKNTNLRLTVWLTSCLHCLDSRTRDTLTAPIATYK